MWPPDDYRDPNRDPNRSLPEHPEEALAAFALNALDDAEFQAVFHHVVRCPHCQEVLLGFQETAARLTSSAPDTPLPPDLKSRTLSAALGRRAESPEPAPPPAPALRPPDRRWSLRRLRRWTAPAAIAALTLLLVVAVGIIAAQQREITRLAAVNRAMPERPAAPSAVAKSATNLPPSTAAPSSRPAPTLTASASASAPQTAATAPEADAADETGAAAADDSIPLASAAGNLLARVSSSLNIPPNSDVGSAASADAALIPAAPARESADVNLVKQEMADVVEATVISVQPETEKLPMTSPLGTEPEAKGVLMVDPSGRRAVLMVSGMPADSYQIWLVRGNKQTLVDRIIVNDDDGAGVKHLELRDSVYDFQEVALLPDERYGPTNPTGAKFLSARIINGPPLPPRIPR